MAGVVLAVAFAVFGVQTVAAQEAFDAPPPPRDGQHKPVFKILKQKVKEMRPEGINEDGDKPHPAFLDDLKEKRDEFRARAIETRETFRTENKEEREEMREEAQEQRAALKAALEAAETPEERQAILAEARAERDAMREEALAKREEGRERAKEMRSELKEHQKEFRVKAKTEVGNRIQAHLEGILKHIGKTLEKFSNILDRINNKIAELEANGADTANASIASATAEQAIADASAELAAAEQR